MMVCTFGDAADVDWWKQSGLPIKQALAEDGCFKPLDFTCAPFTSTEPQQAQAAYSAILGKPSTRARNIIAKLLAEPNSAASGDGAALVGEPKPIEHPVKFYEKGDAPIEFITTRQWFIRILEHREQLLAQGDKINWHPAHMKLRYTHWVAGLNQDWCISRQRFFGVPFPVWYPIDSQGVVKYDQPIFAEASQLPVDPFIDLPKGYSEAQRNQPGGFTGDRDVMDTWATSSLTPQIASHWQLQPERHQSVFPMDVRPQSHEIIRTWAFYTIVKAWMHENQIPWSNVVISGWILDPDRKKMSKSKGNVVTPQHLLDQNSADAVRYWAARARLGVDTAFDEKVFQNGKKLTTKLFNASKFVLAIIGGADNELKCSLSVADIHAPLDLAVVDEMRRVIKECSACFESFEYAAALQTVESFFWKFCDNYVELVKARAYDVENESERRSALATLNWTLKCFLRLFAPVLPYMTEEIWSWSFAESDKSPSVHLAKWPTVSEVAAVPASLAESTFDSAAKVLAIIHQQKSQSQKSLKWPVKSLQIKAESSRLAQLQAVQADICRAGRVIDGGLKFLEQVEGGADLEVTVTLSETDSE